MSRWTALLARRRAEFRGSDRPLNIGHRGAAGLAPENTLAAIEAAASAGADMVEIDVHLSPGRDLVIAHDLELGPDGAPVGPLPSLVDCVARARALRLLVNIEIKNLPMRYAGIEERVVSALARLDVRADVLISSFDHGLLARVRQLDRDLATAVLTRDRLFEPAEYLRRLDADALHPGGYVPEAAVVAAFRASECGINAWTENDPKAMTRLIAEGVTGIITDYPNLLRSVLDAPTNSPRDEDATRE